VTLSQYLQIQRQDQRRALRYLGTFNQALDKRTIFHHIQLKPERLAGMRRDVFNRANAHR